jgi:hypothetical protein
MCRFLGVSVLVYPDAKSPANGSAAPPRMVDGTDAAMGHGHAHPTLPCLPPYSRLMSLTPVEGAETRTELVFLIRRLMTGWCGRTVPNGSSGTWSAARGRCPQPDRRRGATARCAVSSPLSRPVRLFSGIGGHRTHIVRFKRPVHCPVCHNPISVGAVGVEPRRIEPGRARLSAVSGQPALDYLVHLKSSSFT